MGELKKFHITGDWSRYRRDLPEVASDGLPFEKLLRSFKKRFQQAGIIKEIKARQSWRKVGGCKTRKRRN
jgi:ribosomal protein S21